jgi:hypothetical protein
VIVLLFIQRTVRDLHEFLTEALNECTITPEVTSDLADLIKESFDDFIKYLVTNQMSDVETLVKHRLVFAER